MKTHARSAVLLLLGLSIGCGPTPIALTPEPKPLGLVMLTQYEYVNHDVLAEGPDVEVFGFATFAEVTRGEAEAFVGAPLAHLEANVGDCQVEIPYYPHDPFTASPPTPLPREATLDAGELLTIVASGGSFATFGRVHYDGALLYVLDLEPGTRLPTDMSLDVPGAEFPGMEAAVPDAVGLELTSPEPEGGVIMIGAHTTLTWTPSGSPGAIVGLLVVDIERESFLACLADDAAGEFALPARIVGERLEGALIAAGRVAFAVVEEGDAALVLLVFTLHDFVGSPLPPGPDVDEYLER
jgi:hypothetical protein